jgi:hypothetical protein
VGQSWVPGVPGLFVATAVATCLHMSLNLGKMLYLAQISLNYPRFAHFLPTFPHVLINFARFAHSPTIFTLLPLIVGFPFHLR